MSAKREWVADLGGGASNLGLLGEVSLVLGVEGAADALYRRLLPLARHPVVDEPAFVRLRTLSCSLALLAAATRRWDEAREHLASAFEITRPAGGGPLEALFALPATQENVLRREGEYWTVGYRGVACRLRDAKGLHHIARLLAHPERDFDARDLMASGGRGDRQAREGLLPGSAVKGRWSDAAPLLDSEARASYSDRLADLREQLAEAERFNDMGRASAAREEIEALAAQLAAAVGIGGRSRRFPSDAERARVTVTKRIKDVIRRLRVAHPALARHLALAIKTGYVCRYRRDPDDPVSWSS
jgi:hypothetical protein